MHDKFAGSIFPKNAWIGNVCFIKKSGRVLLLCRSKEPMKGKWTGVGGKTKFFEEPLESCIREVKEETGFDVEPKLAGIITTVNKPKNYEWILFIYFANGYKGELRKCSEGALKWVEEEKVYEEDLIGFIRIVLPYIISKERKGIITGKIIHDERGDVLSGIIRNENSILLRIPS